MASSDARAQRAPRSSIGDRYQVLLEIGRTLAGTLSFDELYDAIHRETARVLEASGFYVSLYDSAKDQATIVFFADRGAVERVSITYRGSESQVIRERCAVLVEDRLDDLSLMHLGADADEDVTRSAISAPMTHKGRLLGAISAQSYEPGTYTEEDLALLQGIADIAAVAVDNALHVAELRRRRREAEQIEEIGRALTSSLDPKEVLGKVVDAVTNVLDVDGASVWLCEGPTGRLGRVAASAGEISLPVGITWDFRGPLPDRVFKEGLTVVVDDLAGSGIVPEDLLEHIETGSGLASPLTVAGRVTGVLTAGSHHLRHFTDDDIGVLQRLASQASVALENARLHQNLQALSLTDPLTGLPNRRRLQIQLEQEVAAARRGRPLVLVVFDVDEFKYVNDELGHVFGDDVLRAFAQILHEENRAMNLVARYGGDEFVAVLSDTDEAGARLYVDRVAERLETDPIMAPHGITASTGTAVFDRATMKTMDDIIHAADAEMYEAKARKRRRSSTAPT
jgi:diguanylate cyclase (GGDEF)-like protein